jgi:spermidine/putrescine transport system ATP-binding protein
MLGVPPHKREVNTVFQHYALFPHMRVLDNVAYGLKQRGVPKAERERQAAEALAMVRMDGFERRRPAEMSGGQQQRVALARALVMRPAVLLLDEPLGALDLKLRREMQVELKGIQDEVGITFVIVTHDQEEAMALADRIAVMHRGRIEQLAAPTAVYDAPASAFVAGFVGELNVLEGTVLEGGERPLVDVGAGLQVRAGRVVEQASAGQVAAVGLRPEHVTARSGHTPEGVEATVATVMVVGHELQLVARVAGGGPAHRAPAPRRRPAPGGRRARGARAADLGAHRAHAARAHGPGRPVLPRRPRDGRRHHRARLREGATPHVAAAP